MKKSELLLFLITVFTSLCITSCSKSDDDEEEIGNGTNNSVVVKDDGTTSNGSIFSAIDNKNFYLDYVKYTVEEGHLVVSGYDRIGLSSVVNIVSKITFKGNTYEVLEIKKNAFFQCEGLSSVTIGDKVTIIGDYAFYYTPLTSVTIPSSVVTIGEYAFAGNQHMNSIQISNGLKEIKDYAFSACKNLASLEIPESVTNIGFKAFAGCTGLKKISVAKENSNYDSREDCNAIILSNTNYLLFGCENTTIPNSVTTIGKYAFSSYAGLATITIPDGVTCIDEYAFYACAGLKSIVIPNSVTFIGKCALYGCKAMNNVYSRVVDPVQVQLGNNVFSEQKDTLFVPEGTAEAYEKSDWSQYFKIITDGVMVVDVGEHNNQQQGGNEVNQPNYYKYQESVNVQGAGTMTVIGEATFNNGTCTAIAFTYVYPTKSIAKQVWESYQNDPDMAEELPYYSYDGDKTMTYRFDEATVASLSTMGKDYVCKTVKSTVQSTVEALGRVK